MKKICLLLFSFFMLFNVSPVAGQSYQDEVDESNRQFEEWTISLSEFVKDVRFTEGDVQSLLVLWEEFSTIGGGEEGEEEEFEDFNTVLQNEAYRAWAKSKGINAEMWLKKTMRIIAAMMRETIEENASEEQFDMKAQLEELEAMRAEIGEEAFQEMKKGIEASAAAIEGLDKAYKNLPVPTEAEKKLLAKYQDQLIDIE
jgi:hypothetical protein